MRRLLLLPLLLVLPACGGGADEEKQAYVQQATAVCDRALEARTGLTPPQTAEDFAPYADAVVVVAKDANTELQALTPPEEDAAELRAKFLQPLDALVVEAESFAQQVRAAGTDQAKLLGLAGQVPTGEAIDREYLSSYGLDSCVQALAPQV